MESSTLGLNNLDNMSNNQNKRKMTSQVSNLEHTAMTCDLKRRMRNRFNQSIIMTFRQAELRNEAEQEQEESLKVAFESVIEGPSLRPFNGKNNTPAVNPSIFVPSIAPELRTAMRKFRSKESKTHFCGTGRSIDKEGGIGNTVRYLRWIRGSEYRIQERIVLFHRRRNYGNGCKGFIGRHV